MSGTWGAVQVINGSPIVADPDPNVTPPSADRVFRISGDAGTHGHEKLAVHLLDGTSASVTPWAYEPTVEKWLPTDTAQSIGPISTFAHVEVALNADIFLQITSPVGGPTQVVATPAYDR